MSRPSRHRRLLGMVLAAVVVLSVAALPGTSAVAKDCRPGATKYLKSYDAVQYCGPAKASFVLRDRTSGKKQKLSWKGGACVRKPHVFAVRLGLVVDSKFVSAPYFVLVVKDAPSDGIYGGELSAEDRGVISSAAGWVYTVSVTLEKDRRSGSFTDADTILNGTFSC